MVRVEFYSPTFSSDLITLLAAISIKICPYHDLFMSLMGGGDEDEDERVTVKAS